MRLPLIVTVSRSIALAGLLVAGGAACGSDDESGASSGAAVDDDGAADDAADDQGGDGSADAPDEPASGSSGTATLSLADGTVYEFAMSTCETSNTDEFVVPDSYDLAGRTADGELSFYLARAGLDETFITQTGVIEGDFDEKGSNAGLIYKFEIGIDPLVVDGATVSGAFEMRAIAPTRPHGDRTDAALDVRC